MYYESISKKRVQVLNISKLKVTVGTIQFNETHDNHLIYAFYTIKLLYLYLTILNVFKSTLKRAKTKTKW